MINRRPTPRFVLYLVEGGTEIKCLQPILSSLHDNCNPKSEVDFPPMITEHGKERGDITSKNGITPKTIIGCIIKLYIEPFLKRNFLTPDCIKEIVHVVDMDGAYIEDEAIEYDASCQKFYYGDNKIFANNTNSVIERNAAKRANLDFLSSINAIHYNNKDDNRELSIPYSIYFFSCNLDHFLHGDANLIESRDKVIKAEEFAYKYLDDTDGFIKAIKERTGTLNEMSYAESWDFIKQRGCNSIKPHTNINILLDKIRKDRL